jgi:aminocarboxymuconate-semialdehyde decarboxylase
VRVIDTHFHWYPRIFMERLGELSGYPRAERVGAGYRYYYNAGRLTMDLPPVWFDLDRGLDDSAAAAGSDVTVICTTGVVSGLFDQLPVETAVSLAREYNEQLAAVQSRYPGRFYGTAAIPLNETGQAITVLEEAVKEFGLVGVNLAALTSDGFTDNPRLDDFYRRVAELGVPLVIHPTDTAFGETLSDYNSALQLTIGRLFDTSVTVLRLVFSGILERHPDLKVVQTHGGGLLPYQAGRFDKNTRVPGLSARPSDYLKRLYVDTVCPAELTVETSVRFYGDQHVMYGTDYPCWTPKAAISVLENSDLTAEQRELILHTNAESVFPLPAV